MSTEHRPAWVPYGGECRGCGHDITQPIPTQRDTTNPPGVRISCADCGTRNYCEPVEQ